MLMANLKLVGRQVETQDGPLDLLGVDEEGRLVVFELKRGTLRREAVAQVIDYAAQLHGMAGDELAEHIAERSGEGGIPKIGSFQEWYEENFPSEVVRLRGQRDLHEQPDTFHDTSISGCVHETTLGGRDRGVCQLGGFLRLPPGDRQPPATCASSVGRQAVYGPLCRPCSSLRQRGILDLCLKLCRFDAGSNSLWTSSLSCRPSRVHVVMLAVFVVVSNPLGTLIPTRSVIK